jgi:hypothetical protein
LRWIYIRSWYFKIYYYYYHRHHYIA